MENKKPDEVKTPSEIQVRMKIQKLIQDNTRAPIGMFHGEELNQRSFLRDLFKNFNITPKDEK